MISRIEAMFARLATEKRSAFIPFIMAGDPNLEASQALLNALPAAGADMVELGMPFSDPMADGPVIQAAGLRALAAGTTVRNTLALARNFRAAHPDVPLILMGYYNPIYRFGPEAFAKEAAEHGVDGLIVVDLPPEEEDELVPHLNAHGLALVRLVAPTSLGTRLSRLTATAKGYLYYISVTGITGAKSANEGKLKQDVATIRKTTSLPLAVGFGVKTREQVENFGQFADGVVVGSAIVAKVEANAHKPVPELVGAVSSFVKSLTSAA